MIRCCEGWKHLLRRRLKCCWRRVAFQRQLKGHLREGMGGLPTVQAHYSPQIFRQVCLRKAEPELFYLSSIIVLFISTLFVCLQKVPSRSFCTIFLPASRFLFLSLSLFFLSSQIQEELEAPNPHFMFYLCSTLLSLA